MNINPKNLDALLNMVSKKLGTSPDQLRTQLENGTFEKAMGGMSKEDSQKLQQALSNPIIAEKILSTPQAQAIFKKLSE